MESLGQDDAGKRGGADVACVQISEQGERQGGRRRGGGAGRQGGREGGGKEGTEAEREGRRESGTERGEANQAARSVPHYRVCRGSLGEKFKRRGRWQQQQRPACGSACPPARLERGNVLRATP